MDREKLKALGQRLELYNELVDTNSGLAWGASRDLEREALALDKENERLRDALQEAVDVLGDSHWKGKKKALKLLKERHG